MQLDEILSRREEYVARAALAGMVYDWFDHTFNTYKLGAGDKMYDPDTMELLGCWSDNSKEFTRIVNERSQRYGKNWPTAQPHNGSVGDGTSEGNG